jgi:hypothetical protein
MIAIGILLSLFFIFLLTSNVAFYYQNRKSVSLILKGILSEREIKAITLILSLKFIYHLLLLIKEIVQLVINIYLLTSNKNNR